MSSEGRLNEETKKRRKSILDDFKRKVNESGEDFEQLLNSNKETLEVAMVVYLDEYKVFDKATKKYLPPKANTLDTIRSHLKCSLSELTGFNFGDKIAFSGLSNATATLHKEVKKAGR